MSDEQRCGTCKHWQPLEPDFIGPYRMGQRKDETDEQFEARQVATQNLYGDCTRIEANPRDDIEWRPDGSHHATVIEPPIAFTYDGSDWKAGLRTRAEFGCVLWTAKETTA